MCPVPVVAGIRKYQVGCSQRSPCIVNIEKITGINYTRLYKTICKSPHLISTACGNLDKTAITSACRKNEISFWRNAVVYMCLTPNILEIKINIMLRYLAL